MPGVSAYIIWRQLSLSLHSQTKLLTALVVFLFFHLLPVHLAATFEVFGLFDSVSLSHIVFIQFVIVFGLLMFTYRSRHFLYGLPKSPLLLKALTELPRYIQAVLLILTTTFLVFALNLLTTYPSGFDALNYHFPVATRWMQEQSFRIPPSMDWHYSLPGNPHIGMMIMLTSKFQPLTTAFNVIAFLVAASATYIISFKLTKSRLPALLSVVLFASIPMIQFQTFSGYVDLYGSAFILAGVAIFLYRSEPPRSIPKLRWYIITVFLSGYAWGIAVGSKPTFYVYAFACTLGALVTIWAEHKHRHRLGFLLAAVMTVGILMPSFFWFLRAFDATGNPLYPLSLQVLGTTNVDSLRPHGMTPDAYTDIKFVRSKIEWLFYPWVEYKTLGSYSYSVDSGLGAVFATFVPLGLLYGIYSETKNIYEKNSRLNLILLISFFGMSLIWWFFLERVPRFAIPLLALACSLTAHLFAVFISKRSQVFRCLIFFSVGITCMIAVAVPVHELLGRIVTGDWDRASVYRYPQLIDQLPEGSVVWNLGPQTNNFPIAGKNLSNKVIPRRWAESQNVREFIRQEQIEYIADRYPFSSVDLDEVGAKLIFEGEVANRGKDYLWRVWAIDRIT